MGVYHIYCVGSEFGSLCRATRLQYCQEARPPRASGTSEAPCSISRQRRHFTGPVDPDIEYLPTDSEHGGVATYAQQAGIGTGGATIPPSLPLERCVSLETCLAAERQGDERRGTDGAIVGRDLSEGEGARPTAAYRRHTDAARFNDCLMRAARPTSQARRALLGLVLILFVRSVISGVQPSSADRELTRAPMRPLPPTLILIICARFNAPHPSHTRGAVAGPVFFVDGEFDASQACIYLTLSPVRTDTAIMWPCAPIVLRGDGRRAARSLASASALSASPLAARSSAPEPTARPEETYRDFL